MSNLPIGAVLRNPQTGQTIELTPQGWVTHGQQMPLPEADSKSMESLQSQVQEAQYLDQKAQQFVHGMDPQRKGQGSFATGPAYGSVGIPHIAENINPLPTIVGAMDPRMGELESISNQAWVHMRPQGSGAIRGYEAKDFKAAFPNVTNWGPENQAIAGQLHQDAMLATQKLAFIDNFIRSGRGDYAAANAAWQAAGAQAQPSPDAASQQPQQAQQPPQQPPAIPPPMQMTADPSSPIGAVPTPGAPLPAQLTPQQQQILNWTPDKGLHP